MWAKQLVLRPRKTSPTCCSLHFLNVGPAWRTHLRQCVQHVGPTFRKCNDIVMASLITCVVPPIQHKFFLTPPSLCNRSQKYNPRTGFLFKQFSQILDFIICPFILAIFYSFLCLHDYFSTLRNHFVKRKKQLTERTVYSNRHYLLAQHHPT